MQSLISGAECATTSNPLSQVLKHSEADRSLQQDRVGGPSTSRLQQLPFSRTSPANTADLALARQFFDSGIQQVGNSVLKAPPQIPPPELLDGPYPSHPANFRTQDVDPSHWARSIGPMLSPPEARSRWAEEFGHSVSGSAGPATTQLPRDANALLSYSQNEYIPISQPFFQPSLSSQLQQPLHLNWDREISRVDSKGKGKATDAEFEAAFARAAAYTSNQEESRIVEVKSDTETLEDAFARTMLSDSSAKPGDTDDTKQFSDFERVWEEIRSSELPPPVEDFAKWEAEFNQVMQAQREDFDYGEDMANIWQNGLGNLDDDIPLEEPLKFNNDGIPILEPYKFEPNNPHLTDQTSHLTKAKQLLAENGSLTEAALLLEAAIQQGEFGIGGYETWMLLGETRSMDEREEAGMRALAEGVRRAQEAGNNGEGMLSLAISYTNESFERAAYTTLHRWLNARFSLLVPEELQGPLPASPWAAHERTTEAFLAVARQQHIQGQMDPDVQIGLGVLFYSTGEFEKAKDCFESALAVRPRDYLLWNRLGSCLSNGSKPEEALGAYREALRLRPTYTRAIYNVGVACLNIGAHKEAAEHFLSALSLQESARGDKSEQLWQTLRKCFVSMELQNLADLAKPGEDLDTFRREGFEF